MFKKDDAFGCKQALVWELLNDITKQCNPSFIVSSCYVIEIHIK